MKRVEPILMNRPEIYMENTYKLIWSEEALSNLENILFYLEKRWTAKEIRKFATLLDKKIDLLQQNPLMFPEVKKPEGLRKLVLSKQTSIYYKIQNQKIKIITLYDNRKNPNNLLKE